MRVLNFNSPYALIGLTFAVLLSLTAVVYQSGASSNADPILIPAKPAFESLEEVDLYGARPRAQAELFDKYVNHADVPNFRDAGGTVFTGSDTPCFEVTIDPTVEGNDADYRLDMFGGAHVATSDLFRSELSAALSKSFTEEVWARDNKCFAGSFVVSFSVTEQGRLGQNMLVHHLRGSSSSAGFAVLDVLREMELNGHRWHDGDQPAGEVRIPVRFKLME